MAQLEHVNVTVRDGVAFSKMLCELFDWHVRWSGDALDGSGITHHVGTQTSYVAVYEPRKQDGQSDSPNVTPGGLNHIGVVVEDYDDIRAKVEAAGLNPGMHHEYEPGRRFYFHTPDGIEIEVISYG